MTIFSSDGSWCLTQDFRIWGAAEQMAPDGHWLSVLLYNPMKGSNHGFEHLPSYQPQYCLLTSNLALPSVSLKLFPLVLPLQTLVQSPSPALLEQVSLCCWAAFTSLGEHKKIRVNKGEMKYPAPGLGKCKEWKLPKSCHLFPWKSSPKPIPGQSSAGKGHRTHQHDLCCCTKLWNKEGMQFPGMWGSQCTAFGNKSISPLLLTFFYLASISQRHLRNFRNLSRSL